MKNRYIKVFGVVAAGALAAVSIGAAAFAHTHVAESNPGDGASVEAAPAEITVRFGEEAVPASGADLGRDARGTRRVWRAGRQRRFRALPWNRARCR